MKSGRSVKFIKHNRWLILILLLSSVLMFTNLNERRMYTDETHTALLARNILNFGYPTVTDGINTAGEPIIKNESTLVYDNLVYEAKEIRKQYTWIHFYVAALGLKIFGVSSFGGRFFFALFGVLSLIFLYLISKRLSNDKKFALFVTLLFSLYVPLYLYARQTRYYSMTIFFALVVVHAYLKFLEKEPHGLVYFIVANVLSFHTFYVSFFSVYLGITLHFFLFKFNKTDFKRFLKASAVIFVFTFPWFFALKTLTRVGEFSLIRALFSMFYATFYMFMYLFPVPFLFLLRGILYKRKHKKKKEIIIDERYALIFLIGFGSLIFLIPLPFDLPALSYTIFMAPLFTIIIGKIFLKLIRFNKWVGVSLLLIFLFTNFIFIAPFKPFEGLLLNKFSEDSDEYWFIEENFEDRYLFYDYLYEITHEYKTPQDKIIEYLSEHAKKGDVILDSRGSSDYVFYLNLIDYRTDLNKKPDWIILREPPLVWSNFTTNYDFALSNLDGNYEKIVINATDYIYLFDTPHPRNHRFRENKNDYPIHRYETYPIEIHQLKKAN